MLVLCSVCFNVREGIVFWSYFFMGDELGNAFCLYLEHCLHQVSTLMGNEVFYMGHTQVVVKTS